MLTRTIIAAAIAGAFALPLAVQAADHTSNSGSAPSASTRGGGTADGSNTSQSDIANTPGKPGSSSPSSGEHAGVSASEFSRLDKNHDGYLSKDEVKLHPVLRSRFASLDKDHDGKLSQSEVSGGTTASTESRTRISRNDTTESSTSNVNPSRSTRGSDNHAVTGSAGTSGAANVTQSDIANAPGTPGSSSPSR